MLTYPNIDPVAIQIGQLAIHWYGLMYLIGIAGAWCLASYRITYRDMGWSQDDVNDLVFYSALGVILGGRLGYVFFYDFANLINDPISVIRFWNGGIKGMSFHGGLLGVLISLWLFCRIKQRDFWDTIDFIAPLVPLGLAAGRLGNFINGELWGKPTDVAWGMVFPHVDAVARHPSQLYEYALEGFLLFAILWWYIEKPRPKMAVSGMFALCYGSFRFFVEFFREPDAHLGYLLFDWVTMGQILSLPLILIGLACLFWSYHKERYRAFKEEVR